MPVLEEYALFGVAATVADTPVDVVESVEDCTGELGGDGVDEEGEDDGDDVVEEDVSVDEGAALDFGAW